MLKPLYWCLLDTREAGTGRHAIIMTVPLNLLVDWLRQGAPKHQLQHLALDIHSAPIAHFWEALAQCPALERLIFSVKCLPVIPSEAVQALHTLLRSNAIPRLRAVEVPREFALPIIRHRTLRTLGL